MKKTLLLLLLMAVAFSSCKKDDPVIAEYTVSFDSQGGSSLSPVTVPEGSKIAKPSDPEKEGETFLGWYKEKTYTTIWDFDKDVVTQNLSLYARWAKPEQHVYTVSFETNGGSEVAPLKVLEGDKLVKPTDPTKTDYSFLGWYTDAALTELWQFDTNVVKEDITLYARWSNPGEKVYTVSFDTDGGSLVEDTSVVDKEKVSKPADPTKLSFKFEGWYSDLEKTQAYDFDSPVTADITLYAKWTKPEVAFIDFNASGLSASDIEWDESTKTLDISNAISEGILRFNVSGVTSVNTQAGAAALYDITANSIGGMSKLNSIVQTGTPVEGKLALELQVPVQASNYKVPLEVSVIISNSENTSESLTIYIKSFPFYENTAIKPVKFKVGGKEKYWAPVNAGATKILESFSYGSNVNATGFCGNLFQWGRKDAFQNTSIAAEVSSENADVSLGVPTGEAALADMSKWAGKFICETTVPNNTRNNWLLFEAGKDNPTQDNVNLNAWYQKLWNKGSEADPVKTEYDPCPNGWRVPTEVELKSLLDNQKSWNNRNNSFVITGEDEGSLVLPVTSRRTSAGVPQSFSGAIYGNYWVSSVVTASGGVKNQSRSVSFSNEGKITWGTAVRAIGNGVRCIQQ